MPTTTVNLPNGQTAPINHPEGATDEQILAYAKSQYESGAFGQTEDQAEAPAQPEYESTFGDYARSLGQGLTFGFGDEIEAKIAAKQKGTSYEEELARIRGEMKQFEADSPVASMATEFVGSFLMPGGMIGKAATKLGAIGKAAAYGAGTGGLYSAGKSEADVGSSKFAYDVAKGATTGGAVSSSLQGLGQLAVGTARLAKGLATKADKTNVPAELNKLNRSAHQVLEKASVKADTKTMIPNMLQDASDGLKAQGFNPNVHKKAAAIIKDDLSDLANSQTPLSITNLIHVRSKLYKEAEKMGYSEGKYVIEAARNVDDYIDRLARKSPEISDDAVKVAREIHMKTMKVNALDNALKRAEEKGVPKYKAYRTAIEKVLNGGQRRFFDEKEIETMKAFLNPSLGEKISQIAANYHVGSGSLAGLLQLTHMAINPKMAGLQAIASGAHIGANQNAQKAAQEIMDLFAKQQAPKAGARVIPQAPLGLGVAESDRAANMLYQAPESISESSANIYDALMQRMKQSADR